MTPAELLVSCPHYEKLDPQCDAIRCGDYDIETCGGCGGDPRLGPSCICPVFGEKEEDD